MMVAARRASLSSDNSYYVCEMLIGDGLCMEYNENALSDKKVVYSGPIFIKLFCDWEPHSIYYCIQEKFRPWFIFALFTLRSEGKF